MTLRSPAAVMFGAALAACLHAPAGATPLDELIAPEMGNSACFARVYDAAHLRRHPRQKITAMKIWLRYEEMSGNAEGLALDLGISIVQRADPEPLFAQGDCIWDQRANVNTSDRRMIKSLNKDEAAVCMISAQPDVFESTSAQEGGVLLFDPGKDGDTIMIYLDDSMTMVKRAARRKHLFIRFGTDDRVFMLRRVAIKDCAAVEDAVTTPEPGVEPRSR
jgi:hypothetical protein